MSDVALEPEQGIEIVGDQFVVTSLPAWLRVVPREAISKYRWVRVRYSSGFFDAVTRPIIRFRTKSGGVHHDFMNGAVLGSAEWIGRVPDDTISIAINPNRTLGPLSFRIDRIESISRAELVVRGLTTNPRRAFLSVLKRLTNSRQSARDLLKFANGATPFSHYHKWYQRLRRPVEFLHFDRPRQDWSQTPEIVLFARLTECSTSDVERTLSSLQSQFYDRWYLYAVDDGTHSSAHKVFSTAAAHDRRLKEFSVNSDSHDPIPRFDDALLSTISFGDQLQDYALGAIAETATQHPDIEIFYSDEDSISDGNLHSPVLKPDWSPVLNQAINYIGDFICVRSRLLAAHNLSEASILNMEKQHLEGIASEKVHHISRILCRRACRPRLKRPDKLNHAPPSNTIGLATIEWPGVSIVLPTRDRPGLLDVCLSGLRTATDYPDFEVIVVDNDTKDSEALAILSAAQSDPRFKVIRETGPFNYSRLCNAGVRAAQKQFLAFLNNDIIVSEPNWLKALISVCRLPRSGMVGAKLLFPDGKLQHAGVTLGMGGLCGHSYFNAPGDEAGYLSELRSIREVSAVTAACCAVERTKFLAASGFDEINFPVELNDIDLCLRIAEQGWQNYWTPHSVMIHLQSASRGVAERPHDTFAKERAYFFERWGHLIRNDPYFHPAMALFAHRPALG